MLFIDSSTITNRSKQASIILIMNNGVCLAALSALIVVTPIGRAGFETFNPNAAIPEGNLAGITFSGAVTDIPAGWTVTSLTLGLNLSGGYDGNLYCYLVAPNGTAVGLLNQPGVTAGNSLGNPGAGMNLTFQDGGMPVTASSDFSTGTYAASGPLANFNGSSANGTWQLFFADEVTGGGTRTLNSWSLGTTAVPEPGEYGFGCFQRPDGFRGGRASQTAEVIWVGKTAINPEAKRPARLRLA
jgi:subtilisin-like proprotein convertase family protein